METEIRKVQSAGYVTVTVSLPRNWVKLNGIKPGDRVSVVTEDDGSLRILPEVPEGRKVVFSCVVDAEKCSEPGLLPRVIAGLYITGQERFAVRSKRPLSEEQTKGLRELADRLIGMGIVEETPTLFSLQSFVDPTKYPVHHLLRRIYSITAGMLNGVVRALNEGEKVYAEQAVKMEDEADKIYWLVVRQLLLAAKNPAVAAKIGVASPLHLLGNRVVAKALEEIGDRLQAVALETISILNRLGGKEATGLREITAFAQRVRALYDKVVKAFSTLNISLANEVIAEASAFERDEVSLTSHALTEAHTRICEACVGAVGGGPPRGLIMTQVVTAAELRAAIWNLAQVARHCKTIAEITINRGLESPSVYVLEQSEPM